MLQFSFLLNDIIALLTPFITVQSLSGDLHFILVVSLIHMYKYLFFFFSIFIYFFFFLGVSHQRGIEHSLIETGYLRKSNFNVTFKVVVPTFSHWMAIKAEMRSNLFAECRRFYVLLARVLCKRQPCRDLTLSVKKKLALKLLTHSKNARKANVYS